MTRDPLRIAFVTTALLAGGIFWIAPRPGMGDFSEHAAQIALLHDLVAGSSRWADLVRVNYFTPYWVGYGLALPLSFVMPVVSAMKLLLTLAYYGYVAACVALRRTFHDDDRLDWLFLPGFFGLAFQYGFFTYLVAAPLGILFLWVARRYATSPTRAGGLRLFAAGVLLFFCHALVFLFACAAAVGFLLVERRPLRAAAASLAPFAGLGLLCVAYFAYARLHDPLLALTKAGPVSSESVDWEWTRSWGWHRALNFPLFVFASGGRDSLFFGFCIVFVAAPWLMGWRPNRTVPASFVTFAVAVAVWFLIPAYAMKTQYLYQRAAIFLLPAYAVAFRPSPDAQAATRARARWVPTVLAGLCIWFLAVIGDRERRFTAEAAGFETVLAAAAPGERALGLVFAPASDVIRNPYTFHAHAVWYEVDKGGFVDFNFAAFLPQVVRFRDDKFPRRFNGLEETPEEFDWKATGGRAYRYFFVRHLAPLPPALFDNEECRVELRAESRDWSLFERMECR
ncbi:MAG: hypothetical protein ACRELB_23145 [Polyangiaceae bacterium]